MRNVNDDYNPPDRRKKRRRLAHPGRFILFIVFVIIIIWMVYSFIVSLSTGQKFSILGPSSQPVRNLVVAGVDEGGYRTDLIMFCQIDRRKDELNILQIPRDTRTENHRNDKKINSAYFSGFDVMSSELKQVTGLKATDYIIIGFDGFSDIIDAIGGVTVNVPIRMYYTDPVQNLTIDLQPGEQKLNGKQAQMFMRFRKNNDGTGYPNGDMDRIIAQKQLYSAVKDKLLSPVGVIMAPVVLAAVMRNSTTNLSAFEMMGVLRDIAVTADNMKFYSLPGGGKYIGGVSYFVYDKNATKSLVNENFVTD